MGAPTPILGSSRFFDLSTPTKFSKIAFFVSGTTVSAVDVVVRMTHSNYNYAEPFHVELPIAISVAVLWKIYRLLLTLAGPVLNSIDGSILSCGLPGPGPCARQRFKF
jgi:hypothetical protein